MFFTNLPCYTSSWQQLTFYLTRLRNLCVFVREKKDRIDRQSNIRRPNPVTPHNLHNILSLSIPGYSQLSISFHRKIIEIKWMTGKGVKSILHFSMLIQQGTTHSSCFIILIHSASNTTFLSVMNLSWILEMIGGGQKAERTYTLQTSWIIMSGTGRLCEHKGRIWELNWQKPLVL